MSPQHYEALLREHPLRIRKTYSEEEKAEIDARRIAAMPEFIASARIHGNDWYVDVADNGDGTARLYYGPVYLGGDFTLADAVERWRKLLSGHVAVIIREPS